MAPVRKLVPVATAPLPTHSKVPPLLTVTPAAIPPPDRTSRPPLLTVAVRFCFRSEVETNTRLFQGLLYEQVDALRHDLHVVTVFAPRHAVSHLGRKQALNGPKQRE